MKPMRIYGPFRDFHAAVTVRLRDTRDIRDPRQAYRYQRRRECVARIPMLPLSERGEWR